MTLYISSAETERGFTIITDFFPVLQVLLLVLQGKYLIALVFDALNIQRLTEMLDSCLVKGTPTLLQTPTPQLHASKPREASKTLREIGVITVDVPASRSKPQT